MRTQPQPYDRREVILMSGKSYIWQKTREALMCLQADPSPAAIQGAKVPLAFLNATQPVFDDDSAREAWTELRALAEIPSEQMTDEQKDSFVDRIWRVYSYTTGLPKD